MTGDPPDLRPNKGFHPLLDPDPGYLFVDACMQAWPDADWPVAHRHGVSAIAVTAWRPHDEGLAALDGVMHWHAVVRRHDNLVLARTADDVANAHRDRRLALVLAAQGGDFVGGKVHRVEAFHQLGLRMMLFAYNASNALADGALDRTSSGLTRLGVAVVRECNRLGILIDGTHVGERATIDLIETSEHPIVFSHSNASALVPSPRNISDEQIRRCVERGGVVALAPFGPLVMRPDATSWPTTNDFIDHVDHVVQLTGTMASVGIGTDMSLGTYEVHPPDPWPQPDYPDIGARYARFVTGDRRSPKRALADFNSYAHLPRLVDALQARGYDDDAVRALLGGNLLGLFRRVWG